MVKHSVNPDLTQDVDFKVVFSSQFWLLSVCDAKVRLDRGGDAMVFAHVASNYFTLKGSTFCGRSASHVVFDKVKTFLLITILLNPYLGGAPSLGEEGGRRCEEERS